MNPASVQARPPRGRFPPQSVMHFSVRSVCGYARCHSRETTSSRLSRAADTEPVGKPVCCPIAMLGENVGTTVIAVLQQQKLAHRGRLEVQTLSLLPRDQPVAFPREDERGTSQHLRTALHAQLQGLLLPLVLVGRTRTHGKRLSRECRQIVPGLAEVVRTTQRHTRLDPVVAAGKPRCVVAAKADTPDGYPGAVDVVARDEGVDKGASRGLPIGTNGQRILGFALSWAIDTERRQPALQEELFGGAELFLRGVESW